VNKNIVGATTSIPKSNFPRITCRSPRGMEIGAFNHLDPESGMNLRKKQIYDNFLAAVDKMIEAKHEPQAG